MNTLSVGAPRSDLSIRSRSKIKIVQSPLDVKAWLASLPTVAAVRPGQCPWCDAPSCPLGGPLGLWGHGVRDRQMRGPPVPNGRPELVVISVRRYRCVRCDGLCTVVPSGVAPRRHYAATAIGFALALFGLLGMSLSEVRRKVSTWQILGMPADADWVTLRRWIAAVRRGELFGVVRPSPSGSTPRQVAERAAATLCAYAPPSLIGRGLEVQAFHGAARMA